MQKTKNGLWLVLLSAMMWGCIGPLQVSPRATKAALPRNWLGQDSTSRQLVAWKQYFSDPFLLRLIDSTLTYNQELGINQMELLIAQNEIRARKGAYLPFVNGRGTAGLDKVGRYTSRGASDANDNIKAGTPIPDPLPNYELGLDFAWELDIWKRLRNSRKSAVKQYLATVAGRQFLITQLVAEVADGYYELQALDLQLALLRQNIGIQTNALELIRAEKIAARVTELAVKRFEAEVAKSQSRQYELLQEIAAVEYRLSFLKGSLPGPIARGTLGLTDNPLVNLPAGNPSQLLAQRPDIRQAEQALEAAKLDVSVARAAFYPSLVLTGGLGLQAFSPGYLARLPESMAYGMFGNLVGPLVNRNALKAQYQTANAKQMQAVINYERTVLLACREVATQVANLSNLQSAYTLKSSQVEALNASIDISALLFRSARADYTEVLFTQRDAIDSKFELVDIKRQLLSAHIQLYRSLGGGQ